MNLPSSQNKLSRWEANPFNAGPARAVNYRKVIVPLPFAALTTNPVAIGNHL
jgi:hypothetical protein